MEKDLLTIGMAQISPVWLNKKATIQKIEKTIKDAKLKKVELLVFGETFLPGYPYWVSITDGAQFDHPVQKEVHAHYARNAIVIEEGDLNSICELSRKYQIAIYLGIIERPTDRGGHSLYASLVYIDRTGVIQSVHRKLQPTYEERLTWAPGDGNGLRVHALKSFRVGGLNCWENWMPLPRAALYGQGENLHIAVWPGSDYNTKDITRFIARESRSFVVSVSSFMKKEAIPQTIPHADYIREKAPELLSNGGSCIAGPDGEWVVPPVINSEGLLVETIDFGRVYEERQNFDPVGHYSRPDITKLHINRDRQCTVSFEGE
ncbi:carbon-nitrogen hydrolase family protein [Aquimarina hainanensis]|uniref:Carbon-nitrogen hydrolase family protein n=1 Tax=Aquimarina hainanensis TaxID=1578017 RepID=A0ABW5N3E4_9FLAO|nr:carbon-nitrogen hydrolase family protein [Aquimarina sp. TRL1]QKX04299.1 carbon-nitrogen hydrolase family protein [Aquimarina sp. TRL1]